MKKEEITETLEQIVEHLRYYQTIGVQIMESGGLPGDPAKWARALARYLCVEAEPEKIAVGPAAMHAVSPSPPAAPASSPPPATPAPPARPVEAAPPVAPEPAAENAAPPRKTPRRFLFDLDDAAVEKKRVNIFDALPAHDTLEIIRQDLGDCRRCKLCKTRKTIVFGAGSPRAELMLIGEGPGADEDEQGVPFVGRAGQLLTKILEAIHLTREQVYITNVVKCRPPQNRKPEPDETDPCEPFLLRQIKAIDPKLICALGGTAAQALLKTKDGITSLRGRVFDFHGYKLIPTFHPAYLLRNPADKRLVWEDMQKVRDYLAGKIAR